MKIKLLSAALLAASLASGVAFAQTGDQSQTGNAAGTNQNDRGTVEEMGLLKDQQKMAPFFTDDTMKTLRSDEEMKQAYGAMSSEDQAQMKTDCTAAQNREASPDDSPMMKDLCTKVGTY